MKSVASAGRTSLVLGALAVLAGSAFLWDVGALTGMASRNGLAFLAGLALGWLMQRLSGRFAGSLVLFGAATALLALVLVAGIELDGVTRWLAVGPVRIQPALVLAPLVLALAGSAEGRHWRAALLVPIMLVALQPDGATAMALAAGTAALVAYSSARARNGWSRRRTLIAVTALALAAVALAALGIRTPPPVAFVEGTVGIAVLSGPVALLLHALAIALMLAAMLSARGAAGVALAAYFAVATAAAVFWAFPMPVAGASPSHLLGFGLAIGWIATDRAAVRGA